VGALSQQLPLRLMDELIPQAFIVVWNSWLQYWADSTDRRNTGLGD
jgi:hypothetical protein